MNIRKVRWRVQRELDSVLQTDYSTEVQKEPPLPLEGEDRTEWLLWCCLVSKCTMQEANHRYKHNTEMVRKQAEARKESYKYRGKKPKVRKGLR